MSVFFKQSNIYSEECISIIFNDDHPSVIFSAIQAFFTNWSRIHINFKEIILNKIKESITKKQIAIRCYNLIATFSIDYGHESIRNWSEFSEIEKKEIWTSWADIFPIVLENLPLEAHLNTARFISTMDNAVNYLDPDKGLPVLKAWLKRIDYKLFNNLIIDEFEMSIADSLIQLTKSNSGDRIELFKVLVNYNDTNFVLSNLKCFLSNWEYLSIEEKNEIIGLLKSNRADQRWIHAVCFTSHRPPDEILECLFNDTKLFEKRIEEILEIIPHQLLKDSLNLFCGFPQPIWWLALQGKNRSFWNNVIRQILKDETHHGFEVCLQHFLGNGVNGFPEEWNDWRGLWIETCSKTSKIEILLESLTYNTANCSCNLTTTKSLWDTLISEYKNRNQENSIAKYLAEKIEMLQQTGYENDLFEFFEYEFIVNMILPNIQPDFTIITLIENLKFDTSEKQKMLVPILNIISEKPIRFFVMFNYLRNQAHDIFETINTFPNNISDIGKKQLKEIDIKFNYKLDNWIGINN